MGFNSGFKGLTSYTISDLHRSWQEPVNRIAKEWITNDNKDHKQTIRILKQNHTTSTPHLTKQCKTRQLQWFYSQRQSRYRRRSIRSKSWQRNQRRSTNIISNETIMLFNSLNAELNPICHLLALLGAHHIVHVSRIRVNSQFEFYSTF